MHSFLVSLRSEFYKSRKTLAFWGAILLPVVLVGLITFGFYTKADKLAALSGMMIWGQYIRGVIGVMGILLLPIFVVFVAYSVNNIEHRADTWKSIFALPLKRHGIYGAKYFFALSLLAICLFLFAFLLMAGGWLLGWLKPTELKFHEFSFASTLFLLHIKLFLSGLGILSIQFLLSLIWADFIKPMGIGFIGIIIGILAVNVKWPYAYCIPYAHPLMALNSMRSGKNGDVDLNMFSQEVYTGLIVAVVTFVLGYFVVLKKSVK